MIIGVPKEVKDHESRVGITPAGVRALVDAGHTVLVETHAGELSAFPPDDVTSRRVRRSPAQRTMCGDWRTWSLKVKEPVEGGVRLLPRGLLLFLALSPCSAAGAYSATAR